jgi:regulator of protease activity HflC (stomatin/prohibitin superfamily)
MAHATVQAEAGFGGGGGSGGVAETQAAANADAARAKTSRQAEEARIEAAAEAAAAVGGATRWRRYGGRTLLASQTTMLVFVRRFISYEVCSCAKEAEAFVQR